VAIRCGTKVRSIDHRDGRVTGVTLADGERVEARAVVSDAGLATYLTLSDAVRDRRKLEALPLQSPGVCAYLAVRGSTAPPYLRFRLPGGAELCRLLVRPAAVCPELVRDGWQPVRLIAPMRHAEAEVLPDGGRAFLDRVLAEPWWRDGIDEHRVLAARTPADWGREFSLYRESMNPVMTAAFMRAGRLAHRSPHLAGLYLCGSATHPGQWVSFCAVSGVLAADRLREDLPC
jgi:phytoene dehydrogenase-like protein